MEDRRRAHEAKEGWREAGYPAEVIASLRWDQRYSIIRIGTREYAFSRYSDYIAGLRAAWAVGLVPDQGPSSVPGIALPEIAGSLKGVDVDVSRGVGPGSRTRGGGRG